MKTGFKILLFIVIAHFVGVALNLYDWAPFDLTLHFLFGYAVFKLFVKTKTTFSDLKGWSLALIFASLWELLELHAPAIFPFTELQIFSGTPTDTGWDIIVSYLGAIFASWRK